MNNRYFFGILIVMAGGTFLSTSGILLRIMESPDGWQIIFYRSLTFFITILLLLLFKYRKGTLGAYRAIGFRGFIASLLLGMGSVCYIFAMLNTTVANVVFIIGSAPLVTALMAWLILREKVSGWSLIAMFTALLGIGLMFVDGLVSGGMLGNILALIMVFMFAFYLLILRYQKNIDMIPATGLSGLITFALAAIFMPTLEISTHDLIICIALGSFQFGLGFLFLTLGTRYIPAAEVALFAMTESILNPIWVWIGVNEVPSNYTLAGSAIVLVSVIGYSFIVIRAEHRQSQKNRTTPENS
jgi:drug/metabolite transporter (DMT)-like permease